NLNYGFSTEFMLAQNYTFATGLDFITLGGKLLYPDAILISAGDTALEEGNMLRKYRTQYLQLPLTIRMRTNQMGYLTFYGQFGFTAGFLLKAHADDEFDYEGSAQVDKITAEKVDIQDDVSFFRAGMLIGLGAEYSLGGTTALCAGINFNNGFTDVLRGKNALDSSKEEHAISNAIEVSLGVIF
ncbi:MAG TPA: porin family protein, partial [Bacteroidales bacterium]|nr:porin family protein [Bacteroidales bacterium]